MGLISKEDLHQIINAFCFVMSDKQFQVNTFKVICFVKGPFLQFEEFSKAQVGKEKYRYLNLGS